MNAKVAIGLRKSVFLNERMSEYSEMLTLLDYFSVFQAEIVAIKVVVDLLHCCAASFRELTIHSDSGAAILVLS